MDSGEDELWSYVYGDVSRMTLLQGSVFWEHFLDRALADRLRLGELSLAHGEHSQVNLHPERTNQ
jgi:hypothetical protein